MRRVWIREEIRGRAEGGRSGYAEREERRRWWEEEEGGWVVFGFVEFVVSLLVGTAEAGGEDILWRKRDVGDDLRRFIDERFFLLFF